MNTVNENNFAKTFQIPEGLVVVYTDTNDESEPCIVFTVRPKGYGTCASKVAYNDTEEGYKTRDEKFLGLTQAQVESHLKILYGGIITLS